MTFDATYSHGVLKPSVPLDLAEGEVVELTLKMKHPRPGPTPDEVAEHFISIAKVSRKTGKPDDAARNHDKYLYGEDNS